VGAPTINGTIYVGNINDAVLSGVNISWTGPTPGSTTTDSGGNYTCGALLSGTYMVIPSLPPHTFLPAIATIIVTSNSVTQFFVADPYIPPVEIHETYSPSANASNVINYTLRPNPISTPVWPGQNAATGNVPSAVIEGPDNTTGSNSYVIPNQGSNITVSGKTVHGRYDGNTTINNPA
jgi:hypothetical protein